MAAGESRVAEAVVAPGRTVIGAKGVAVGPGAKVRLDAEEVDRLRKLGYLVGEDSPTSVPLGPRITASDGPTVKLA